MATDPAFAPDALDVRDALILAAAAGDEKAAAFLRTFEPVYWTAELLSRVART